MTVMEESAFPSYAQLKNRPAAVRGTAWGVFGEDDQLGSLNHLTPARVRQAARSIRDGVTVNLNLSLTAFDPPLIAHRGALEHEVFGLNDYHRDDRVDSFFPQASTQIDGLRHFGHPDRGFYNATDPSVLVAGRPELGIQNVAERGIAGRGLLIDVAAYRDETGRPIDQRSNEQISVQDLNAALDRQGAAVQPGDIVLIRTGWLTYIRALGQARPSSPCSPGLAQSEDTAAWLWDQRIAMVAADNIALEAWPATGSPLIVEAEASGRLAPSSHSGMLHRILIPLLGLTLGELWDLDALAAVCEQRKQYDFFVTAQPLNLLGGVGSPANAMAIL